MGLTFAADDPNLVVTVGATNGKTGKEGQLSYTNCKVVGNGSFGVVFAAKMLRESDALFSSVTGVKDINWMRQARTDTAATKREDGTEEPEAEIAIKKVLQDKRFKVSCDDIRVPKSLNK